MSGKTWAQRTKEATDNAPTTNLKRVGGELEPIVTFYQLNAPKAGAPAAAKQLNEGETVLGIYEGSFKTKKFGTTMYKVRTNNGQLVAVPGTGQLNTLMAKVAYGAEVSITYEGKGVIRSGKFAGKEAHNFAVAASELKAS